MAFWVAEKQTAQDLKKEGAASSEAGWCGDCFMGGRDQKIRFHTPRRLQGGHGDFYAHKDSRRTEEGRDPTPHFARNLEETFLSRGGSRHQVSPCGLQGWNKGELSL